MRWVSFISGSRIEAGLLEADRVRPLGPGRLEDWLGRDDPIPADGETLPLIEVELVQPILRPGKILGIGLNYAAHAAESVSFAGQAAGGGV